ncbi:MAG: signal peptidase II [Myxococcota bacterium]|nr:signal peptidase II [Myxococcota bacterium]
MGKRHLLVFCVVLLVSVGCDHATKEIARSTLPIGTELSLFGDVLRFELVANPGAFLGLGGRLPAAWRDATFLVVIPILLVVVCAAFLRGGGSGRAQMTAVGLVVGGGIANWLDRILHGGSVTDFVSVGFGPLRTGIFNVADVAIVAGVLALLVVGRENPRQPSPGG